MTELEAAIQKARDVMAAALKKIMSNSGKANNGAEMAYAEAAKKLADIDPTFHLPRKKYRAG
jgi:hypothetical protein